MSPVTSTQLLQELRQVVPRNILLDSAEAMRPFECDGLSVYRQLPLLVALPEETGQVQWILRTCHRLGVPVVTRGAGTGLSGGALPIEQGLLLVLTKLNRIIDIDPLNRTARLQAGVRNLAISEAVAAHGLYYAPDPSSQIACSIGGNVAENSGGVHCLKYGLTVHNVMEVRLLLIDGECAFAGGAGLTDEVEPPHAPGLQWRETMVEIHGPVLADWQRLFAESWDRYAEQPLGLPAATPAAVSDGGKGRVTVNEARRRMGIQRSLLKQIKRAEHRIWFATAYFIPSWTLRRRLKQAAGRGIDVRLLLPGPITDHPGARYASRRYYARLLHSGLRIFEYTPRFFHAKTVLCDDWVTIGSCNFDRWNLQWNLEANQEIDDPAMAGAVAAMFEADYANSVEQTAEAWAQRGWHQRLLEWFWRRVERLSLKIRHRRRR